MGKTLDLGLRIEIHPMDKYCHDISLGLYRRVGEGGGPQFLVHSYSSKEGVSERVAYIRQALIQMLGMEPVENETGWLQFPCQQEHPRALKRAFLDLCKLETGAPLEAKPLTAFDKKAEGDLTAVSLGDGVYRMQAEEETEASAKRPAALARGYAKICEMDPVEGQPNTVRFPCGQNHDAMVGLLMYRSQNVRAAMQEEEMAASRGTLAPPSQQ